jgi:hypothetical protein
MHTITWLSHVEFDAMAELFGDRWAARRAGFTRLEILSVSDYGVEVAAEGWQDLSAFRDSRTSRRQRPATALHGG